MKLSKKGAMTAIIGGGVTTRQAPCEARRTLHAYDRSARPRAPVYESVGASARRWGSAAQARLPPKPPRACPHIQLPCFVFVSPSLTSRELEGGILGP